jgi:primosomal protein N' (replication factor Y)
MARRAGRWRAQAMLRAESRSPLQRLLGEIVPKLDGLPDARKVRWSVDVDPADTY